MHSGFPALPRGSGAEVSSGPRCCLIGWQHPSGRASGARRRGVQRREERSSGPSSWNPLRGVRHGVRFPQVHRQSGTGTGTGIWWTPEPRSPFHRCEPAPSHREAARVLLIPFVFPACFRLSGGAGAAEANPVEGWACGPDQFSGWKVNLERRTLPRSLLTAPQLSER